jgi:hypothetical protein
MRKEVAVQIGDIEKRIEERKENKQAIINQASRHPAQEFKRPHQAASGFKAKATP